MCLSPTATQTKVNLIQFDSSAAPLVRAIISYTDRNIEPIMKLKIPDRSVASQQASSLKPAGVGDLQPRSTLQAGTLFNVAGHDNFLLRYTSNRDWPLTCGRSYHANETNSHSTDSVQMCRSAS